MQASPHLGHRSWLPPFPGPPDEPLFVSPTDFLPPSPSFTSFDEKYTDVSENDLNGTLLDSRTPGDTGLLREYNLACEHETPFLEVVNNLAADLQVQDIIFLLLSTTNDIRKVLFSEFEIDQQIEHNVQTAFSVAFDFSVTVTGPNHKCPDIKEL